MLYIKLDASFVAHPPSSIYYDLIYIISILFLNL